MRPAPAQRPPAGSCDRLRRHASPAAGGKGTADIARTLPLSPEYRPIAPSLVLTFALLWPAALALATLVGAGLVRAGFPLPPADRRIGCIDGLRGYLALSVLVHHAIIWHQSVFAGGVWQPPPVAAFSQFGVGAVALFFMITGFVFYPTILKGMSGADWLRVYIGRAFRILPLVAVSVAAIALILHWRLGAVATRDDVGAALRWIVAWDQPALMGHPEAKYINAGVLWSLWHEWLFYLLLLPACALAQDIVRGRLPSWTVPAGFLAFAFAIKAVTLPRHVDAFLAFFPLGMLAFELQARPVLRQRLASSAASAAGVGALLAGAILFAEPTGIVASLLFWLFFVTVACGNSIGGLLARPAALALGECSYGIYLIHAILLYLLFTPGTLPQALGEAASPLLVLPAALLVVPITAATFLVVERPMIRAGRRLGERLGAPRARPIEEQVAP